MVFVFTSEMVNKHHLLSKIENLPDAALVVAANILKPTNLLVQHIIFFTIICIKIVSDHKEEKTTSKVNNVCNYDLSLRVVRCLFVDFFYLFFQLIKRI